MSIRQTFSLALGLLTVIAVVAGLVLFIPNRPVAPPVTGSIRGVDLKTASKSPTGTFYYGPYFVDQGSRLLMMGSDGNTSTVWASTDGSTWQQISDPGSFGAPDQRFVVLGFADDGRGGLSAVGSGFAAGAKVVATAWHSKDGQVWSPATVDFPTNTQMFGLASRAGAVVSAGNGVAWYSADGTSWAIQALPNATGYVPRAVRAWAEGFAILAVSGGSEERHTKAWVSADGKTWTEAAAPMAGFEVHDVVAYGNGLVAVGAQILTPAELATPTPTPSPSPTPAPTASGKPKVTPKPTATPKTTAAPSSTASTAAGPTASPTPPPVVEVAISWVSPDGIQWFRGTTPAGRTSSMESVTQVFDSLVAVGAAPLERTGGTAAPAVLPLWTSDDGVTWKPIETGLSAYTRARLTPFGQRLVLAGVDSAGSLAVLAGDATLGSPLPLVAVTPTPAFSLLLKQATTPLLSGLSADDTLGPMVATGSQFLVFVDRAAGTSVWSSPDGSAWTQQADPRAFTGTRASGTSTPLATPAASPSKASKSTPKATGPSGGTPAPGASVPTVVAAVSDGKGGVVAVGTVVAADQTAAAASWVLNGSTWSAGTVNLPGNAPSSLGSVAVYNGSYVAAANSPEGARILFSADGLSWKQAYIVGASAFMFTVSTWSGGFIASGVDPSGSSPADVWTSPDGMNWTRQTGWRLPTNTANVLGARNALLATTKGVTTSVSWWWSPDGTSWQDVKLATTGGCWNAVDAGFIAISGPPAGTDSGWRVWASKDARSWQQPGGVSPSFVAGTTCQMASTGGHVVVAGWTKDGVLQVYFGDLTGL
jgi:hypothetical protein